VILALASAVLAGQPFDVEGPSEAVAVVEASCERCDWGVREREAAVLRLLLDGRSAGHLVLARGAGNHEYRAALGPVRPGRHRLDVALDRKASAPDVGRVGVSRVSVALVAEGEPDHRPLAHAPILGLRPGSLERFSDLPLVMWHESEATPRGTRLRYSVVFSNEDGGTPPDRLMATWGRVTDIEYVYGVELDASGRVLAEEFQGRDHRIVPFRGRREGRHPVLFVATENNMLAEKGRGARVALAPVPFDLSNASREAVMDAHPWTYRVSGAEARREGRVDPRAAPGSGRIPDPRRFVYLEACAEMTQAALIFALGFETDGRLLWRESDGGQEKFRIARNPDHFPNGCFRGAVALPEGAGAERLRALRFRSFPRPGREGEPPTSGAARLLRVNRVFTLRDDDTPGPSLFEWSGEVPLRPDGPPGEIRVGARGG
jgi:hypothetical protein